MLTHSTHSFLSSTGNTSSNDNVRGGWEMMKPPCNKIREEKHSSSDPNVSGTSSRDGSACGARSKETLMISGTAASEELKKLSQPSLSTKGKHKCAICMILCEHNNELFGSKNGSRFFESLRPAVISGTTLLHVISYCSSVTQLCRLKQSFSLHTDTTPPQPNHTVTPTHIEPGQYIP